MDHQRAGIEHLQRAGRELIAAAREFLDTAEEMLEDRDVVNEAAGFLGTLVDEFTTMRGARGRLRGDEVAPPFEEAGDSASERGQGDTVPESEEGEEESGLHEQPVGTGRDSRPTGAHDDAQRRSPSRRPATARVRRIEVD